MVTDLVTLNGNIVVIPVLVRICLGPVGPVPIHYYLLERSLFVSGEPFPRQSSIPCPAYHRNDAHRNQKQEADANVIR